ncbi:hypothetical protein UFOVP53_200 [uncultured Caudovirales phage]|uniref:Uncharacterized protein n=1 Tax=uncultured Caudovirales phage TaxID=2100421 RepID=A0A6J5KWT2_9CAUD|nr:hypothetical protein UFOVP53_200 [uncultured Caudovirales phage]
MRREKNLINIWMTYLKENSMCTKSLVWIVMICHVVMLGLLHENTKDVKRNIANFITKE